MISFLVTNYNSINKPLNVFHLQKLIIKTYQYYIFFMSIFYWFSSRKIAQCNYALSRIINIVGTYVGTVLSI